MQALKSAISSLLLLAMLAWLFFWARRLAGTSRASRRRVLIGSILDAAAGAVCVFWLPRLLPETPGSPGTLVGVALLWILGSCLLGSSVPVFLGGLTARPPAP